MRQLQDEFRALLVARGRSADTAEEIVLVASQAAREAIARLTEVVGHAPESHRDITIVFAINMMERLALAGIDLGRKG